MTRIKGYGFTRKDKVFAEYEGETGKYLFKESHSSHKGLYDIGIYNPQGEKVFKISMTREQINRIKGGKGIGNIDFFSEEGFNNYMKATYVDNDFDEERFRRFVKEHFVREYQGMNNEDFYYYNGSERVEGTIDEFYAEYLAYLVDKSPGFILENIYNESPDVFVKTFHYTDKDYETAYLQDTSKGYGYRYKFLDSAKAQILQALNTRNIDYMSYDEFVASKEYENYPIVDRSMF